MTTSGRLGSFERDGLRFDVSDSGPRDGPAVVLLHGWPGGAVTWDAIAPALHAAGHRVLAPDQRGYSPQARPRGRRAYVMDELVADVVALLDAAGVERAHLVGHDWGGAVAWTFAAQRPDRLASLTVLSTPHPRAMARSIRSSDQGLRSAYMGAFQLPFLPERVLLARGGALLRTALRRSGLPPDFVDVYVDRQRQPGALTGALAWYRALPLTSTTAGAVTVPTRYVWGSEDAALGRRAAELTADHVEGPYTFEVIDGASHWLPEAHPDRVAASVIDHADHSGHAGGAAGSST